MRMPWNKLAKDADDQKREYKQYLEMVERCNSNAFLHPTEIHQLKKLIDHELEKKKYEKIVNKRICKIVMDAWDITGFEPIWSDAWTYVQGNLWDSLMENGDILIICPQLDNKITQDMLISDDWQEELKEKLKKTKDTL